MKERHTDSQPETISAPAPLKEQIRLGNVGCRIIDGRAIFADPQTEPKLAAEIATIKALFANGQGLESIGNDARKIDLPAPDMNTSADFTELRLKLIAEDEK